MKEKKGVKKTRPLKGILSASSSEKKSFVVENLKKPRIFIPLVGIAVLVILFFLKGLFVAALVNGQPISRISLLIGLEKKNGKQELSQLVSQTLILQEASKKNINVSQQELDDAVSKIQDTLSKQGQNLDLVLNSQGLSKQEFLKQLKIQKIVEKRFALEIKVTDKQVDDYIEKNKSTIPETMKPEDVKATVKQQLQQQQLASKFQTWLDGLQKNAKINYFVNY